VLPATGSTEKVRYRRSFPCGRGPRCSTFQGVRRKEWKTAEAGVCMIFLTTFGAEPTFSTVVIQFAFSAFQHKRYYCITCRRHSGRAFLCDFPTKTVTKTSPSPDTAIPHFPFHPHRIPLILPSHKTSPQTARSPSLRSTNVLPTPLPAHHLKRITRICAPHRLWSLASPRSSAPSLSFPLTSPSPVVNGGISRKRLTSR